MALGTILGAVAGGVASAGAGALASKMFGGKSSSTPKSTTAGKGSTAQVARHQNFNGGGLTGRFDRGAYRVTSSNRRANVVGNIAATFSNEAAAYRGLRERVVPGFSDLRNVRLAEVDNARSNAIGNLRENLARRRVLGSSFAADALTRAEREFAQERDRVQSEVFLQELAATEALLQQEFEAGRSAFNAQLNEMNLQAELAANLASKAAANMGRMAELEAKLAAESSQAAGRFYGDALEPAIGAIGKGVSNWVGGLFQPSQTSAQAATG